MSTGTLLTNLAWFRVPDGELPADVPFVSILVPARNEARVVEACVRSLLAQNYPAFEVLVLDDHSEDGTGEILRQLASESSLVTGHSSLRVLQGAPLPTGWGGKNWACHQLAQAASPRSRWLLFTDADTVHAPDALRRAVAEAEREGLALLSLMPEQRMETWGEQLGVSLLAHQILAYLPLPAMERTGHPAAAASNGQFMLFRRAAYQSVGGHAACAGHIAEDVLLGRRVKAAGGAVRLGNGAGLVRCRMYHSAPEVVAGFRRSFAGAFHISPALIGTVVAFNILAYGLPFLRLHRSRLARGLAAWVLALRLALAWRTRTPWQAALAHPFGIALVVAIQTLAAYDAFVGKKTVWKGRVFGEATAAPCEDGDSTRPLRPATVSPPSPPP